MTRTTIDEVLDAARARLVRLTPREVHERLGGGVRIVDVRTREQVTADGHLPEAMEVSLNVLEWRLDPDAPSRHPLAPGPDDLVVVVCGQGFCSSLAATRLQAIGFARATDMVGGFEAWRTAGLPIVRLADDSLVGG